MKKPLITGASVSADWLSDSPGKRLALRHTPKSNIKVIARGGNTSATTVATLKDSDLKDRTSVIAIDAFFWDSTLATSKASVETLRKLVERTEKLGIPLVLGEIPLLLPHWQQSACAECRHS